LHQSSHEFAHIRIFRLLFLPKLSVAGIRKKWRKIFGRPVWNWEEKDDARLIKLHEVEKKTFKQISSRHYKGIPEIDLETAYARATDPEKSERKDLPAVHPTPAMKEKRKQLLAMSSEDSASDEDVDGDHLTATTRKSRKSVEDQQGFSSGVKD
jgi:hypothetical protein